MQSMVSPQTVAESSRGNNPNLDRFHGARLSQPQQLRLLARVDKFGAICSFVSAAAETAALRNQAATNFGQLFRRRLLRRRRHRKLRKQFLLLLIPLQHRAGKHGRFEIFEMIEIQRGVQFLL
jgi:hypothetical protein